jgi:CubicO group peptidase (beta-lactamase class C family)
MTDLREIIETERQRFNVPGVAVVVVSRDEVLLCEGFGEATVGGGAVTADTHFPIASDTKCFTAAALCVQADAGLLDLDAPVRDVLPWFAMADDHATALVSVRDLLSHRTGLPRHDLVWYGGQGHTMSLEEITRSIRHLPLSRQLRQAWQYNNLCYAAAGYVTEALAGAPWADAVRDLLLTPIGMKSTVFSAFDPSIGTLATPYKQVGEDWEQQELPADDAVGPAGTLVSTANDLALWLQARLGAGPLSDGVLQSLHEPAMLMSVPPVFPEMKQTAYALGNIVATYRGSDVRPHGGNLMGYSSAVMVAPTEGYGVAVLTNLHGTGLRDALQFLLLDAVLGREPLAWGEKLREREVAARAGAQEVLAARAGGEVEPTTRPLEDFAGSFEHPAYGTLTLSVEDGALAVDFHHLGDGLQVLHRGRDRFDVLITAFDRAFALVPQLDEAGAIAGYAVPLEALVAPIVFTRTRPQPSAELVASLLGRWTMGPHVLTIAARGAGLVASVPGSGSLALEYLGDALFTSPDLPALRVTVREADLLVDPLGAFTRAEG